MLLIYLAMVDSDEEKDLVEKLYNTYKNTLYNICFAIVRNRTDAEDAVHDTFIRIIDNLCKIKDVDSPQTKAFCIVIARNVAVDILRKSKKSVFVTEEELDFYESDIKNEETALSNIGVERLKLPKEYYDVLMLNVKFGCSLSEMSGILGISYQAVRYKLRKARSILLKETEVKNEQH
mgnify:CR=1 FL=1